MRVSDWPGEERRHPPLSSPTWAVRAPLAGWLERQARIGEGYRVLDVGCGPKPYYPFFAERASEYVGVDVVDNPVAELRGPVEALPVEDGSFDLVLCTQVLEHCDDPAQAVRELRRVTAPGGRVLASTHGVQWYHPSPVDYWRWDARGAEAALHHECRLERARGRALRRHRGLPGDASRRLHGGRVPPRARGGPGTWTGLVAEPVGGRARPPRFAARRAAAGVADRELPRRRDGLAQHLVVEGKRAVGHPADGELGERPLPSRLAEWAARSGSVRSDSRCVASPA